MTRRSGSTSARLRKLAARPIGIPTPPPLDRKEPKERKPVALPAAA